MKMMRVLYSVVLLDCLRLKSRLKLISLVVVKPRLHDATGC